MIRCRLLGAILVALMISEVQAQESSQQFQRRDRNKDGKLTKDEFPGPLFNRIDTNRDGFVSSEEDRLFSSRRPAGGRGQSREIASSVKVELDVPYAGTENPRQRLDLYLPKTRKNYKPLPVVVFIHGGGWARGDKRGGYRMIAPLIESGDYVGVSIGYRLTGEAIWPAQIHDCKAAIRWLRANAKQYNIDPKKIGVTGTSAGGHLVAMLGTCGDVPELEGKVGNHLTESSNVACVVDQYGPSDLLSMGGRHNDSNSPESRLVGGPIQDNKNAARNASPTSHVSKGDPPFLFIHGTDDPLVPFDQSKRLQAALTAVGVDCTFFAVKGGGHGGFPREEVAGRLRQFFDKHLYKEP